MLQFIMNWIMREFLKKRRFNTSHVVVYQGLEVASPFFSPVSIHLMLQFIKITLLFAPNCATFQYISCCSLSPRELRASRILLRFNTSHVVVYPSCMQLQLHIYFRFNTSHVVVYLIVQLLSLQSIFVSIHLMLQFIYDRGNSTGPVRQFQYISCCSLSVLLLIILLFIMRFNTSHVVVYQKEHDNNDNETRFQYISCCSLSRYCCTLYMQILVSIHLMLQFISMVSQRPLSILSFNTSHVVVYRSLNARFSYASLVSIHLMLQFICKKSVSWVLGLSFQYISCCSLSRYNTPCCVPFNCFNTSHVVVYLIGTMIGAACDVCFNTSHVVVYRGKSARLASMSTSFNTSHVVVYQFRMAYPNLIMKFQYISCCSLSIIDELCMQYGLKFQYISCCSLSIQNGIPKFDYEVSIHLMLQFISFPCCVPITSFKFQYISCCSLSYPLANQHTEQDRFQYISCCSLSSRVKVPASVFTRFNTSHVVVYL